MNNHSKGSAGAAPVENIAFLKNVSSGEHFSSEDQEPRRVLSDINLLIKRTEAWGINARSLFEIKLLLEIIANIKPYVGGKCVLAERGMPRHKRTILQHVFYIGNSDMLYNNMNVLEYLTFAMARLNIRHVELQEQLLDFIVDIGLSSLLLTPVRMLTKEEKAVVTLIVAAYSDSLITVFNLPEQEFDGTLMGAIAKISGFMRDRGKTLVVGTQNCLLIEKACSHTAFIADGKLIYQGTVEDLRFTFDKVVIMLRDKDIYYLMDRLALLLPEYKLSVRDGSLLVSSHGNEADSPSYLYRKIVEAGIVPEHMEINPKTVCNGYEELILQYDLQNKLL